MPNVGKSTLFNCLSSAKAQAANFPFCTIDPQVGIITVPDEIRQAVTRQMRGARPGKWLRLSRLWTDPNNATSSENALLLRWAKANGIPRFSFYAARKSFATIARKEGVEKATIDDSLADIYITERNWDLLRKAQQKVVRKFRWELL